MALPTELDHVAQTPGVSTVGQPRSRGSILGVMAALATEGAVRQLDPSRGSRSVRPGQTRQRASSGLGGMAGHAGHARPESRPRRIEQPGVQLYRATKWIAELDRMEGFVGKSNLCSSVPTVAARVPHEPNRTLSPRNAEHDRNANRRNRAEGRRREHQNRPNCMKHDSASFSRLAATSGTEVISIVTTFDRLSTRLASTFVESEFAISMAIL